MKRKTFIIIVIVSITILLIGTLKIFIKTDTVQTQKDRLSFFTGNLSTHQNTIIGSFQNYSALIIEGINNDSLLVKSLRKSTAEIENNRVETIQLISDRAQNYFNRIHKIGFSSLVFNFQSNEDKMHQLSIKNSISNFVEVPTSSGKIPNFDNSPLTTYHVDNHRFEIRYSFPFPLNEKKPTIYIETGFDISLLREMIGNNIADSRIGFLVVGDSSIVEKTAASNVHFLPISNSSHLFFDDLFLNEVDDFMDSKTLNLIINKLNKTTTDHSNSNFSIYLPGDHEPLAITFSRLEFDQQPTNFYIVSLNYDFMLSKTNDWNNQIFLINIIIILLIMFGITYLFINRISLLKQKKFIEESEMKLKEMNKSKDRFFSIIAHDLKNPFNGIMGMTAYLNESYNEVDEQERREIINDLNISSKNAFNLLQNLLEWTRTQSGTIKNIPVKIDPASIIEISLETVANLAKNKEIDIKFSFETGKYGYADENLVATVLRNLLTNAVKFSPRKSEIEVSFREFKKELVFCVKDSGIGLRDDEIDQLFRIDVNFHKKGTEDETGTGLGLKICQEFVEYCQGRIWVISEPQKGSSFYFTIPLYRH
jgi:signal transduction histidine kinase